VKPSLEKTLRKDDGSFNYDDYVRIESNTNKLKFHLTSFSWDELDTIVHNFKSNEVAKKPCVFALCQGVRNGSENRMFSSRLGFRVVGTDISDTIVNVSDGVLMDFHDCPKLWFEKVDFLYSNSWDQSYDMKACLTHWKELLSKEGLMYIVHTPNHLADANLSVEALKNLVETCGLKCKDILKIPAPSSSKVFFRRVKKFFFRLMGHATPMSQPMKDTVVLVLSRPG
jgi:hypothetical protein